MQTATTIRFAPPTGGGHQLIFETHPLGQEDFQFGQTNSGKLNRKKNEIKHSEFDQTPSGWPSEARTQKNLIQTEGRAPLLSRNREIRGKFRGKGQKTHLNFHQGGGYFDQN